MSAEPAGPAAALVAFGAAAWAFREPERAAARTLVYATIAQSVAGVRSERVAAARPAFAEPAGRLRATVFGYAESTPLAAAFLNALACGDEASLATPVVCAALAAGEGADAPGAVVLDAVVAGCEVAVRLERALGASHVVRGWDVRGTCGRVGATIAAGRVLGLQREPLRDAIGIAATAAGGLTSARSTMTAAFVPAAAAADGVEAALLARAGFTGAPAAIDGRRGLAALMSSGLDAGTLGAGLGETFLFAHVLRVPDDALAQATFVDVRDAVAPLERLASVRTLAATFARGLDAVRV